MIIITCLKHILKFYVFDFRMMPGAMPIRGPPGQGPRTGAGIRGPMGRGDYGKCRRTQQLGIYDSMLTDCDMVFSLLVSQVTILLC